MFPLRQRRLIRGRLIASLGFPLRGETLVKAGSERGWRDVAVAILAASAAAYSQCGNSNDKNLHSPHMTKPGQKQRVTVHKVAANVSPDDVRLSK